MKKRIRRKLILGACGALLVAVTWISAYSVALLSPVAAETSKKEPGRVPATKRSNTWICLVVCGITGIIVYFIGQAERREQRLREEEWERQEKEREREEERASPGGKKEGDRETGKPSPQEESGGTK